MLWGPWNQKHGVTGTTIPLVCTAPRKWCLSFQRPPFAYRLSFNLYSIFFLSSPFDTFSITFFQMFNFLSNFFVTNGSCHTWHQKHLQQECERCPGTWLRSWNRNCFFHGSQKHYNPHWESHASGNHVRHVASNFAPPTSVFKPCRWRSHHWHLQNQRFLWKEAVSIQPSLAGGNAS